MLVAVLQSNSSFRLSVCAKERRNAREGRRAWSSVVCHRLSSGFFKPIVFFLSFCLIFPSISPVSSDTIRPPGTRRSKISNSWYHYCIKWLVLSSAFSVLFQEKNPISSSFLFAFPPPPASVVISNPSCVCSFFFFFCPCFCFLVFKSLFF